MSSTIDDVVQAAKAKAIYAFKCCFGGCLGWEEDGDEGEHLRLLEAGSQPIGETFKNPGTPSTQRAGVLHAPSRNTSVLVTRTTTDTSESGALDSNVGQVLRNDKVSKSEELYETEDHTDSSSEEPGGWTVIYLDGTEQGWKEENRVAPATLPTRVWVLHLNGAIEEVDKTDIEPELGGQLISTGNWFSRLSTDKAALENFQRNPPEQESESDQEYPDVDMVVIHGPDPEYRHQYLGEHPPKALPKIFSDPYMQGEFYYKKVEGKAFIGAPDPGDVLQGIGNCYFMASLASIAATERGKAFLEKRIARLCQDPEQVSDWYPVMMSQGEERFACAGKGKKVDPSVPLWPAILERDYAQHKGDYNAMVGGTGDNAFGDLGLEAQTLTPRGFSIKGIKEWLQTHADCALVLGSPFGWSESSSNLLPSTETVQRRALAPPIVRSDLGQLKILMNPEMSRAYACTIDPNGIVTDPKTNTEVGRLLDDSGQGPGAEIEDWCGTQLRFSEPNQSTQISLTHPFSFEKSDTLSCRHQYAITEVTATGVVLWNTDSGGCEVELDFEDISKSVASITAGKYPDEK